MSFERMYVTNKGSLLSAKTLQGKKLEFDHIEIGSGIISGQPAAQEALANKEIECSINSIKIVNTNQIRISFLFTNKNLANAFYFREIGLFAIDPDTEEKVLYAYANAGDTAEYINNSSTSVIEKYININVAIDNAENVTINVDPTQSYVSQKEFDDTIEEINIKLENTIDQQELDDFKEEVTQKISTVYKYKGSVSTYENLPTTSQTIGDVYNVETADSTHKIKAGDNVAWNGSGWDVLAGTVDLSDYILKSEVEADYVKKTSIAPTTKTLTTTDFALDETEGLYKAVIADNRITASSMVIIDPLRASRSVVDEAKFEPDVDVVEGTATIYCTNQPTESITLQYTVIGGN